jgi:hypothetical protein
MGSLLEVLRQDPDPRDDNTHYRTGPVLVLTAMALLAGLHVFPIGPLEAGFARAGSLIVARNTRAIKKTGASSSECHCYFFSATKHPQESLQPQTFSGMMLLQSNTLNRSEKTAMP